MARYEMCPRVSVFEAHLEEAVGRALGVGMPVPNEVADAVVGHGVLAAVFRQRLPERRRDLRLVHAAAALQPLPRKPHCMAAAVLVGYLWRGRTRLCMTNSLHPRLVGQNGSSGGNIAGQLPPETDNDAQCSTKQHALHKRHFPPKSRHSASSCSASSRLKRFGRPTS